MEVKPVQPEKALEPKVLTLSDILTFCRELQFENGTAVPDQGKNAKLALIIVVPAEGAASVSAKDVLDKTAAKMKKNDVEVHYEFRESAFYMETTNP